MCFTLSFPPNAMFGIELAQIYIVVWLAWDFCAVEEKEGREKFRASSCARPLL